MPLTGGCKGSGDNPLIGSWKFSSLTGTTTNCYSTAVFKDGEAIISYPEVPALPNNAYSKVTPARTVSVQILRYMPSAKLVVAMSGGFSGHSGVLAITGSFVWMCMVALLTGTGIIRLRAGSHWEEREVPACGDIPEPIARVARLLRDELPGSRLILGELKRQETVLDPYLLVEHNGECVCLGIWENNEVIACAS